MCLVVLENKLSIYLSTVIPHTFNEILPLSKNLLKISSFNLPVNNCLESSLYFSRTAFSQTEPATLVSEADTTSNSTDINPLDYSICGIAQCHVYQSCVQNVDELKQHLLNAEHVMEQSINDNWRMSLQASLWLMEEILSKCCNNIYNWLNQQHYYLNTLIR